MRLLTSMRGCTRSSVRGLVTPGTSPWTVWPALYVYCTCTKAVLHNLTGYDHVTLFKEPYFTFVKNHLLGIEQYCMTDCPCLKSNLQTRFNVCHVSITWPYHPTLLFWPLVNIRIELVTKFANRHVLREIVRQRIWGCSSTGNERMLLNNAIELFMND